MGRYSELVIEIFYGVDQQCTRQANRPMHSPLKSVADDPNPCKIHQDVFIQLSIYFYLSFDSLCIAHGILFAPLPALLLHGVCANKTDVFRWKAMKETNY